MINRLIDYVIPFVDNSDKHWQSVYNIYNTKNRDLRYRDWDTLRYLLRSIEKYLPWVNNIFIVLSIGPSLIPSWLNTLNDKIHIVYDFDIVPKDVLPVFNSNVIDLYIPNIKDLSEYYLYSCDDYIITKPLKPEDFYSEDKVKLKINRYRLKGTVYSATVFNSVELLCPNESEVKSIDDSIYFETLWADHTLTPHIKSINKAFLELYKVAIKLSLSRFRESKNLTWLIYPLNLRNRGLLEKSNIEIKLLRLKEEHEIDEITFDGCDIIVINDIYIDNFNKGKLKLILKMQKFLPDKSQFEK